MSNTKLLENTARWRKTKKGMITNLFHKMKNRHEVDFTLDYLHEFAKCKKFERLFIEWEKSGYQKNMKPTIDRISNKKGYSSDNIQWMSWGDNRFKQTMERRNRSQKVAQIFNGEIIAVFKSQRDAIEKTGVSQGNLAMVLSSKRNKTGGFNWKYIYETPDLLK